ncbi:MAG: ThuA domain-containing protein [Verrucomicrobia bacterium]|nr:ThuA domain-containing protein [Verrucomicrobiota bacterium]
MVLIAGPITGHPKEAHEYEKNVILLKHLLETSPNLQGKLAVEAHFKGWPHDPATLDDADTIFLTSDGSDRRETDHPLYVGDRLKILERQMRRGCGLVLFHWSTFNPVRVHEQITEWAGGYFDYETGAGPRKWYSAIQTWPARSTLGTPGHAIARGVKPFATQEEYYYRIRFREKDPRLKPIVLTRPPNEANDFAVGWAVERADGGRGFGFTGGHFYANWWNSDFRKLILNAVVWTAKLEVPPGGVESEPFAPFKTLILTGHNHPAHDWRAVTAALILALEQDPRAIVHVTESIEDLATEKINDYELLVMNYNNWDKPGLSEAAKANFVRYLQNGGGLALIHFANGAFNLTLPSSKDSEWPEFRTNIVRRAWMAAEGRSGHDNYGPFRVEITDVRHPILGNLPEESGLARARTGAPRLKPFDTVDELYFRQEGVAPIEPLATARSKVTGKDEPMAWAYPYGKGRVFQTLLGHADESVRKAAALIRRGCVWAAGRNQISFDPPPELTEGALFRDGSPWTPEQSRKRAAGTKQSQANARIAAQDSPSRGEDLAQAGGVPPRPDRTVELATAATSDVPPLPGPLLPPQGGEGELTTTTRRTERSRFIGARPSVFPLPKGEGQGEGNRSVRSATFVQSERATTNPTLSPSPLAPSKLLPPNLGLDQGGKYGHWGNEGEEDWVDDRWNKMVPGSIFSSSLQTVYGVTLKSIAIRVGDQREGGVCFDAARLNFSAGWLGGFIRKSPKRFGIIEMPRIDGTIVLASPDRPAWGDAPLRYRGLYLHGPRVVLSYEVGGSSVLDSPWLESSGDLKVFTRTLELGPSSVRREITLLAKDGGFAITSGPGWTEAVSEAGTNVFCVRASGAGVQLTKPNPHDLRIGFPPHSEEQRLKIAMWSGSKAQFAAFKDFAARTSQPEDLSRLIKPGPARWNESITTRGSVGRGSGPFVMDTLTLPYDNPYKALVFVSGHDFFNNGDAALCTLHGDVWRASGIDDKLEKLAWKRVATGLFQPLGLKIVNDQIHVLGRDQITRLHDRNGDGEADFYENFHNGIQTSDGGHDFVTCLETDRAGHFYYLDPLGLHRVSADGSRSETLATGWRNPNGLAINPDGVMIVSPQEGEWTPTSQIAEVKLGGYYGFKGPQLTPERPLGYDPPLCWIPRYLDNSSGGEVWVPPNTWGALGGQLIHFSYGRCQMMLVLRDIVEGQTQGAIVPIQGRFLSGIMRGRFRPQDGHLYASGLKGWVTSALRDGCLQRVRYTGKKLSLPVAFQVHSNGLRVTFSEPLDRAAATDAGSYGLEQWNYRYAAEYGSKEYSALQPASEGHDSLELRRVALLEDGRTVFLGIPDLKPVMQLQVQYNLEDKEGAPVRGKLIATVNRPGPAFQP